MTRSPRAPGGLDAVLVAESDHFLPQSFSSSHPYTFGPLTDYFSKPLARRGLPFQYHLPNTQQLGPVALGTWLRRRGDRVRVFDNVFRVPEARAALWAALAQGPRVVGISTAFLMKPESVARLAGWARERAPGALVLLGGFNAERNPALRVHADATAVGPGERTLAALLDALREGRSLEAVPNLLLRRDGVELATPREPAPALSELPAPDWDLLEHRPSGAYSLEASKGCRYVCAFCSYYDKGNQRMRPVSEVVAEVLRDRDEYGARVIRFIDANLTSYPAWVEELCAALARARRPVQWSCFARADDFARAPRLPALMADAGCVWVFSGMESGDDGILSRMRKGCTAADAARGAAAARAAGLRVHGSFIVGYPGETPDTVSRTLDFISKTAVDTAVFTVLGVTEELEEFARREPERALGLERVGHGWRHATMDWDGARAQVERCLEACTHGAGMPLVAPYGVTLYYLLGAGFSMDEGLAYLRAFRDFHRAERAGDAAAAEACLDAVERDYARMLADMGVRLPSAPAWGARAEAHAG